MKLVGYARVSTVEQNLDMQVAALKAAGCTEIFTDHGLSGADFQRPGLLCALRKIKRGDMLVVWRLDRLGRSLVDLIQTVNGLSKRGCDFRSLTESIDTSSSGGRLVFHMMAAMAEFERAIIGERTKAGMEAARARGSRLGRRRSMTGKEICEAWRAIEVDQLSVAEVAARYHVHPKTLSRLFREERLGQAN
ncbi:recombinase family protein [Shinella sp. DD12]|uniref:recombinase family protein n=1 Tax=Shinella sp. DD12 TaxID=1410620 RepID=UPI000437B9AA|nr:recombinase family protein [Shinella sp. DD12]EYR81960.1 site-specific recombinase [Shinella sp. DD12]